jgi:hypothetical protein
LLCVPFLFCARLAKNASAQFDACVKMHSDSSKGHIEGAGSGHDDGSVPSSAPTAGAAPTTTAAAFSRDDAAAATSAAKQLVLLQALGGADTEKAANQVV